MYMIKSLIFVIICIMLIFVHHRVQREGFTQNKSLVLMGDSILNNEPYVEEDQTVESNLIQTTSDRVFTLAKDHSTIQDVYSQLDAIPISYNNAQTYIVLSVGGNNLLSELLYSKRGKVNVRLIFDEYKKLVLSVRKTNNKANLFLVDIYYPISGTFHKIIHPWNALLYRFAEKHNIPVVKISESFTQGQDFINHIEPSQKGSKIIAETILKSIYFNFDHSA